ncbi:MAG: phosphate ABC transporter permease PstA [Thermodesulfobacteriota bacterium]
MDGRQQSRYWREGEPWVWLSATAVSLILLMATCLLLVVLANGLGVFWPHTLTRLEMSGGPPLLGEILQEEERPDGGRRLQLKIGNRDLYGLDFRWVPADQVQSTATPPEALVLERQEYGNFYGFIAGLRLPALGAAAAGQDGWPGLAAALARVARERQELTARSEGLSKLNRRLAAIKDRRRSLLFAGQSPDQPQVLELERQEAELAALFASQAGELSRRTAALRQDVVLMQDAAGREREVPLLDIVRAYRPNAMSLTAKLGLYLGKLKELLLDDPRESNTEGGLFPAILGTVMMVFLMSLFSFPFGVLAGIYLREYAKPGPLVRLVRVGVNNLAGIPSIVYGIFGLGFFIYGLGAAIDQAFFPERLPTPTFGTGGILWASLTLGLLTVPVVIVATEEALGAIPTGIREGSLALGSTRFQTLTRILVPMASPGIMTGFILAMARAAGEVAPLMITGVVKLAPAMPVDGVFPYLHLDRKFMHLGFHIYDIGFQSPNVEAAKPMVFTTTLLLVGIVVLMTSGAILLRNRMRRHYYVSGV